MKNEEYTIIIHPNWTDAEVKQFNRNCYRHNICIRYNLKYFSRQMCNKSIPKKIGSKLRNKSYNEVKNILKDVWNTGIFESNIKRE